MKIRLGFVSNSSSSSFTCQVCGREEMGMDLSMEDAEMYTCNEGHTFCQTESIVDDEARDKYIEKIEGEDSGGDVPSDWCPICQMKSITSEDAIAYLTKKAGYATMKEVEKEMLDKFKSYAEMKAFIKGESK